MSIARPIASPAPTVNRARRPTPHDLVPIAVVAMFVLIVALGCRVNGVGYDGSELTGAGLALALMWALGHHLRARRLRALVTSLAAFLLIAMVAALASAVLAVGRHPLIDAELARADAWLMPGFDWPATMRALARWPRVTEALALAYTSLNWQPMLLLGALALAGPVGASGRFLAAWSLALTACVLPFPWFPAVGGYHHYDVTMDDMGGTLVPVAWTFRAMLDGLRDGTIDVVGVNTLTALVTFPSFHACAAVLLAWGAWPLRRLRWPMLGLNAVMWVSAVPMGGHYLVDLLAGSVVAIGAIHVVDRLGRPACGTAPPTSRRRDREER